MTTPQPSPPPNPRFGGADSSGYGFPGLNPQDANDPVYRGEPKDSSTRNSDRTLGKDNPNPGFTTRKDAYREIYTWTPEERRAFQRKFGLLETGNTDDETLKAWEKFVDMSADMYKWGNQKFTPDVLANMEAAAIHGQSAQSVTHDQTAINLTNRGQAKNILNQVFQAELGRSVTEKEVSAFQARLNSLETSNPQQSTMSESQTGLGNTKSTSSTSVQSGGVDPAQAAQDYAQQTYGPQINSRRVGVDYFNEALRSIGAINSS